MDLQKWIAYYNLKDAISKKDHAKVQKFLQGDIDVNFQDANNAGKTLLHIAVEIGDLSIVQMLLNCDAKNLCNFNNDTPLMLASRLYSQGEVFAFLSERCKDPRIESAMVAEPEITFQRDLVHNCGQQTKYQTLVGAYVLLKCQPRFKTDKFYLTYGLKGAGAFNDIVLDISSPLGSRTIFVQIVRKEETDILNLRKHFMDYIEIRENHSKLFKKNFSTLKVELIFFTCASINAESKVVNYLEPFDIAPDDFFKTNAQGKGFLMKNNQTTEQFVLDSLDQPLIEEIFSKEGVSPDKIAADFLKCLKFYYCQADETEMKDILLGEIGNIGTPCELDIQATFENFYHSIEHYRAKAGTVKFLTEKCDFLKNSITFTSGNIFSGCTYETRPGKASIAGQLYESKLLGLILNRLKQKRIDFNLGSNVDGVGQFDDLVMRYFDEAQQKYMYVFIQAKHRENPGKQKITDYRIRNLQKKDEFNLFTNFGDYLDIREKFKQPNADKFFQTSFDKIDIELAIFTTTQSCITHPYQADQNYLLKTNEKGRALHIMPNDEILVNLLQKADKTKIREILQNEGKDVNDLNCKSIIEDFFKSYKIYYNQANEEKVGKINMDEIGTDDSVLYLIYHDLVQTYWKMEGHVNFLTKECNFLEKAKQKVNNQPKLRNVTEICFKFSQRFNLEFTQESFQELGFDQILADERIINVWSKVPILSMVKICQHLMQKFKQSLAIVDFDQVAVESGEILSMFLKPNEFKCLIVRSSKEVAELKQSQLRTKLAECGKIIILISEAGLRPELFQIKDWWIDFADLTTNCRSGLMESKMVSFQGRPTKLVDLIGALDENGSNAHDKLITGAIFLNMLANDQFEIAPLDNEQIPYYIARRFKMLRKIKSFQNHEKFEIVDDTKNIQENLKDLVIISEAREHFDEICSRHPLRNVHWFKRHKDHFLWQCSSNSVAKLRDALQYDDEEFSLENFESFSEQVVIIADEPGMGKSTLMTQLEQQNEISSLSMVIRINLNDYTSKFKSMENKTVEFEEVKSFLLNVLQKSKANSNSEMSKFEQILFDRFLNKKNVILLVDGFDEIAPNYVEPVLEFLNTVKNRVRKLIITTRDNSAKNKLESSLNVFAHSFVPFTENDIRNFLEMFWTTNLKDTDWNHFQFEKFVTSLLNEYTQNDYSGESFMSTPLHIEMIATCFQAEFEEYIKSGSSNILNKLRREFNLYSLYEKFIKIYLGKIPMDPSSMLYNDYNFRETFEESHTRLALCSIFDDDLLNLLLSREEHAKIKTDIENVKTGKEKRGFISRIVDGKPQFAHLTFAKFFVAKAVWKWLKQYSSDQQDAAKVLLKNLIENDRRQICQFIHDIALRESSASENATILVDLILGELKSLSFDRNDCYVFLCDDFLLSVVEHCLINFSDAMLNTINLLTDVEKIKVLTSSAKMGYSKLVRILATQFGMDVFKKAMSEYLSWKLTPLGCEESSL
ncbi:uncharacterized protein LOC128092521 [Culex pipiens pallens]|uniref:uncharacterized protein LOC128092521 n=1 Tax=Culex pipiens pallens TaxID=42434 RepID=UPI0022A9F77A|nr:uncharacterized protein LOC128092521 [Culex pipiens pallens]XP_052562449.1 uncharacterized protein LOC128092521 [Culex pipiens pallens]